MKVSSWNTSIKSTNKRALCRWPKSSSLLHVNVRWACIHWPLCSRAISTAQHHKHPELPCPPLLPQSFPAMSSEGQYWRQQRLMRVPCLHPWKHREQIFLILTETLQCYSQDLPSWSCTWVWCQRRGREDGLNNSLSLWASWTKRCGRDAMWNWRHIFPNW